MTPLQKLQDLFRELFQLDLADLDFGIYRLLRLKRDEVEAFLTEQLPRRVREEFAGVAAEEKDALERALADLAARVRAEIAEDAILSDGEIAREHRDNPARAVRELLDEYRSARERLAAVEVTDAQQAEVFNHLYNFFSRYYEGGDFIPRRRYGAREAYAVPYNGEETFFYWANRDQHYVKTAAAFRDYAFTVDALGGPFRVRFVLTQASVPPGNVKGDTRYFFPEPDQIEWDAETKTLRVPFHYRLPTEGEVERWGKNARLQEGIIEEALSRILDSVAEPVLKEALAQVVDRKEDEEISLLKKRLRHFARKQTTDYFIHKDLGGFLRRELEFYLKDQVLHVADLDGDLDAKRRTLRVVRELADEVITFLAQIEDAQKQLYEKRKFVLRTDYLVPIMHVPRELWPEVAANQKQVEAWREVLAVDPDSDLFNSEGKLNLEGHPTLVVDTEHFEEGFPDRLLALFDDIDGITDGLLIQGENYQALSLLQALYSGLVKCVYIDPPYNTGADEFTYKDRYQHSSWLAMMCDRLLLIRGLLKPEGTFFTSIDHNEIAALKTVLDGIFQVDNFEGLISWRRRHNQPNDRTKMIGLVAEYLLAYAKDGAALRRSGVGKLDLTGEFSNPDNDPRGDWASKPWKVGSGQSGTRYVIETPTGKKFDEEWMGDEATYEALLADNRIIFPRGGDGFPRKKYFKLEREEEGQCAANWWEHSYFGHNAGANATMTALFGEKNLINNPKPVELIRGVVQVAGRVVDLVADFFAGSGTTGHAVINLNREDGGGRKFILVEMGDYFDTVLLPRIKKVTFTPDWQDGKPNRFATPEEAARSPRIVKVIRLESYEDALHNVGVAGTATSDRDRADAHGAALGRDAYRLRYLVRLPVEASASMLELDRLEHPFDYTIEVLTEDGPRLQRVDLVETFNFLYGLHVQRLEAWSNEEDGGRRYRAAKGTTRDGRYALVLWRDMTDLDPAVERRFLEPKIEAEEPFDEKLINGDCAVPGVQSLDNLFKRLMEEGET